MRVSLGGSSEVFRSFERFPLQSHARSFLRLHEHGRVDSELRWLNITPKVDGCVLFCMHIPNLWSKSYDSLAW